MENSEIMADWAAENRDVINRWVQKALKCFWEDASARVPRTEAERRNGMEAWLEQQRLKLSAVLEEEFQQEFLSLTLGRPQSNIISVFDMLVWPQVKPGVQRYAIFGSCAAWIGHHLGDATTISTPKCDGQQWYVPIGVKSYGDDLGRIVLNLDGEVIPELTTTRSEVLEAIRELSLPSLAASAR